MHNILYYTTTEFFCLSNSNFRQFKWNLYSRFAYGTKGAQSLQSKLLGRGCENSKTIRTVHNVLSVHCKTEARYQKWQMWTFCH